MSENEKKMMLKFTDFCKLCEKISTSNKDRKGEILRRFISDFRQKKGGKQFFPVLRLLLPQLDRERGVYGLREHALAQKYVKVLSLSKESHDAKRLLNFRVPKTAGTGAGDFSEVVYWVVKNRHSGGEELSIDEVNTHLDKIAEKHAEHNPRGVDDELVWIVQRMSPLEIKWLTRILIKDMKLGLGHKGILKSYHYDALELFDVSNSLSKICDLLHDPLKRLHEIEVSLFTPFRPMLAEKCDVQKVEKELAQSSFHYIETKWDGERCQLHYCEGEFKYFTRNGFDFTDSYGSNESCGSLTPRLSKQINSAVKSVILDGEVMAWYGKYKCYSSKGMNIDVKSLRMGNAHQPCFCAFDVLLLNGTVITNKPYKERIKILSTIFKPLEGVMVQTISTIVKTGNDVMKMLNTAIDNREEGIVLKHPDSVYKPNVRKGGWFKIKPEYTGGAMEELDLLIIGGYYGDGRRRGFVSHFLMAVALSVGSSGDHPQEFLAVGRVGSGCTMDELAELNQKLNDHWNKRKTKNPPAMLRWTKERPDLWIEPQKSVILQIKASEIAPSDNYPVNYSIRFPRIEKVRYDKPWYNCLTLNEFNELRLAASGKLISTHISMADGEPVKPKRMRMTRAIPTVDREFLGSDLSGVNKLTEVFDNKEICVIVGNKDYSKDDLEAKIVENGGKVVQNPGNLTFFVISGSNKHVKVYNITKSGRHDVVTVDWFMSCIEARKVLEFKPKDLLCMSKRTQEKINHLYDIYCDSYTKPATMDSLKESLNRVKEKGDYKFIERPEMLDVDILLFNGHSPFGFFRHCTAYFFKYKVGKLSDNYKCPLKIAAINFMFMGGKIVSAIDDETVTHVVVHSGDSDYVEELKGYNNNRQHKFFVVNEDWIMESWKKKSCLDEQLYLI